MRYFFKKYLNNEKIELIDIPKILNEDLIDSITDTLILDYVIETGMLEWKPAGYDGSCDDRFTLWEISPNNNFREYVTNLMVLSFRQTENKFNKG